MCIDFQGFDPSHLTDLFYTFSGALVAHDNLRGFDLGAAFERNLELSVLLLVLHASCWR